MRFSLLTLLLACLTAGSGIGVYVLRGAWKPVSGPVSLEQARRWLPADYNPPLHLFLAPDNKRLIRNRSGADVAPTLVQYDGRSTVRDTLFIFPRNCCACFADDDTVVLYEDRATQSIHGIFVRRYPEWWWGHFYRREVWFAIVFGTLFVGNASRRLFARKIKRGAV
ncbi:MAG TPA: hypothetical protein VKX17_26340 [Planctomycetota bacterium]|nr:hypothetical protein [Planctomycetota bacterium]